MFSTSGEAGIRTRIQSGFFGNASVGITLTGILASFSAPRNLTPASTFAGVLLTVSLLICFDSAL